MVHQRITLIPVPLERGPRNCTGYWSNQNISLVFSSSLYHPIAKPSLLEGLQFTRWIVRRNLPRCIADRDSYDQRSYKRYSYQLEDSFAFEVKTAGHFISNVWLRDNGVCASMNILHWNYQNMNFLSSRSSSFSTTSLTYEACFVWFPNSPQLIISPKGTVDEMIALFCPTRFWLCCDCCPLSESLISRRNTDKFMVNLSRFFVRRFRSMSCIRAWNQPIMAGRFSGGCASTRDNVNWPK